MRYDHRYEYLIITTKMPLLGVPGTGGKARIGRLISEYGAVIGLKDWAIWDEALITALLNAYQEVAARVRRADHLERGAGADARPGAT